MWLQKPSKNINLLQNRKDEYQGTVEAREAGAEESKDRHSPAPISHSTANLKCIERDGGKQAKLNRILIASLFTSWGSWFNFYTSSEILKYRSFTIFLFLLQIQVQQYNDNQ